MDYKQIKNIIRDFEESSMTIMEIETEGFRIRLSKNKNDGIPVQPILEEKRTETFNEAKTPISSGTEVRSPLVGTFYVAKGPKDEPFASVGQHVEAGKTLCIIEAMKIMNEITAPISGVIEKIMVKNGTPVGFDDVLMVIS
jgi:acetyl-CoA carboxylase biotin carboxyl carrier protein